MTCLNFKRLSVLLLVGLSPFSALSQEPIAELVSALNADGYDAKLAAAARLVEAADPRTGSILQAMIDGSLFTRREDGAVVIAEPLDGGGFALSDPLSGDALGEVGRRGARRISVNNQLRRQLRGLVAGLSLADPSRATRIAAIEAIVAAGDADLVPVLEGQRNVEQDDRVIEMIDGALVAFQLESEDPAEQLSAVIAAATSPYPSVRTRLSDIARNDAASDELRAAAEASILSLEQQASRFEMVETLFFGLSLGSILVLAAIGLSITFGVMGVINMAHGELIMLGAYTTYVVQTLMPNGIDYSLFVAIPAAFLVSALVGVAIERGVIRFLYGRPLETLLATFGVSLILQQAVRSIFGTLNKAVIAPGWMSGSWQLAPGLSITFNRLYILLFSLMVFVVLLLILQRTRLGLEVRAVTQNRAMAQAMGINSARVDMMTFGLGAGIAGVAGVALSQLTNVGYNLGQSYIVDSFMVVVFGGVGNLWGTLVAGLSLGTVSKFIEPAAGAVVAKILVLVFIILFIQKRPRGLFPQKGRAADG